MPSNYHHLTTHSNNAIMAGSDNAPKPPRRPRPNPTFVTKMTSILTKPFTRKRPRDDTDDTKDAPNTPEPATPEPASAPARKRRRLPRDQLVTLLTEELCIAYRHGRRDCLREVNVPIAPHCRHRLHPGLPSAAHYQPLCPPCRVDAAMKPILETNKAFATRGGIFKSAEEKCVGPLSWANYGEWRKEEQHLQLVQKMNHAKMSWHHFLETDYEEIEKWAVAEQRQELRWEQDWGRKPSWEEEGWRSAQMAVGLVESREEELRGVCGVGMEAWRERREVVGFMGRAGVRGEVVWEEEEMEGRNQDRGKEGKKTVRVRRKVRMTTRGHRDPRTYRAKEEFKRSSEAYEGASFPAGWSGRSESNPSPQFIDTSNATRVDFEWEGKKVLEGKPAHALEMYVVGEAITIMMNYLREG